MNSRFVHSESGSGPLSQDWSKAAVIGDESGIMELKGIVDEFYIYTKALSNPEIFNLAQACAYGKLFSSSSFLICILIFVSLIWILGRQKRILNDLIRQNQEPKLAVKDCLLMAFDIF